jgi:ketosteroid isomerase-like protein
VSSGVYDRRKTGRIALRSWLCALLVALAGFARAEEVEPALWSRLQRIETAFRGGDAQALRAMLPGEAKVRVDLRDLTDGPRSYGPGQLEVVLQQIFQAHRNGELTFRTEDVKVCAPGTAFARGRWARRAGPGTSATVDYVTFTLREQAGDWRIHEILCSR